MGSCHSTGQSSEILWENRWAEHSEQMDANPLYQLLDIHGGGSLVDCFETRGIGAVRELVTQQVGPYLYKAGAGIEISGSDLISKPVTKYEVPDDDELLTRSRRSRRSVVPHRRLCQRIRRRHVHEACHLLHGAGCQVHSRLCQLHPHRYAGIALLVIGLFLVATGIIGCIGACCNSKLLLIIYIVVMGVLALVCVGLAVGYMVNKAQMREAGSAEMKRLLEANYQGRASANEYTNILDLVQARVPCCGVENYTDFNSATNWNRTYQLTNGTYIQIVQPVSCCKTSAADLTPTDETCTYAPNSTNSNYMSGGCYAQLWTAFDNYSASAVYGLFIAAAVLGIIAGLAIIIVINLEKDVV